MIFDPSIKGMGYAPDDEETDEDIELRELHEQDMEDYFMEEKYK